MKDKTKSFESKWPFRPLAYLYAFFHPIPPTELRSALDKAQATLDRCDETIREYDALHEQVQKVLSTDTLSCKK